MNRKWKKLICFTMSFLMLLSQIQTGALLKAAVKEENAPVQLTTVLPSLAAEETLLNFASECDINVPSEERPSSNMVDGDDSTLWINNGGLWPCKVTFSQPGGGNIKPVKKIVIKLEKGHPLWSINLDLSYALNSVIDAPISITSKVDHSFEEVFTYEFTTPQEMSHLYISLSNPKNDGATGGFYPAIAEVELYTEQDVPEETYENIASASTITLDPSAIMDPNKDSADKFVDGNYETVQRLCGSSIADYKINHDGSAPYVQFDFTKNKKIGSFELAVEKDATSSYTYQYTIQGKALGAADYSDLAQGEITRVPSLEECRKEITLENPREYASIRIVLDSSNTALWPVLAEVKIFANVAESPNDDKESIAWQKPVHTNANRSQASRINDGNKTNSWSAAQYPAYADIDLEENYNLSEIQVFTPASGFSQYSIYTSMDGRDFKKAGEKTTKDSCPATGESWNLEDTEARFVRVYLEYNSNSPKAVLNELRVLGTKSSTPIVPTPAVQITPFNESTYNITVTEQDTKNEVMGIIERTIGAAYINWFDLEVKNKSSNGYDFFELSDSSNGKIKISGNNGVSLATGLNHYLKYYCNVSITEVGNQVKMPANIVPIGKTIRKETEFPVRYAFNYCTMSYSMPFWGVNEWRTELDWLALNGVNVVLDITAQEEVWREFLGKIGYDAAAIKDFIAGPAYYAWAYMANLSGAGGPVHDSWFTERTELSRQNHLAMQKLGMSPVLQGYSGMIPNDLKDFDASAANDIIPQSTWCAYQRPDMLKTTSATYKKYAKLFYECQENVYGKNAHYYATDPFHEGGSTGSMNPSDVSENVMKEMLAFDKDAVWIIQAWQGNPTAALLNGLHKEGGTDYREHALILDLYAEKSPSWQNGEYQETPWVYCMLNNFGGRMGLHGHMDNFNKNIPTAANTAKKMKGIGITPEASHNNPVLYDLLFETIWCDDASAPLEQIDLDSWLKDYTTRRYGSDSDSAYQAMLILKETVYKGDLNMNGQGAPESVVNARPALSISAASTWGNAIVGYEKGELEKAAQLLLNDFDTLKASDAYLYDLADVLKQVLSNSAQKYHQEMAASYNSNDPEAFNITSQKFLDLIDMVEKVLSTREEFLVGTWVEQAKALASNADDFTKDLYEYNAKALITTWGSIQQAESGGLKDYSNRQWAGLTKDFYKVRWTKWIENCKKQLNHETPEDINWFERDWEWARANTIYTTQASTEDLQQLGIQILKNYSAANPAADDSNDLPIDNMTAESGSFQSEAESPQKVLDNNPATIWHSKYSGDDKEKQYLIINLGKSYEIDGLRYQPRSSGANGIITSYEIWTSTNGTDFTMATTGNWLGTSEWKKALFDPIEAQYVKLVSKKTLSDPGKYFTSAAEVRITGNSTPEESIKVTEIQLPQTESLKVGESKTLNATILPTNADNKILTWKSSDKAVATVTNGVVQGIKEGTATITATATDGSNVNAECTITITPTDVPRYSITITPTNYGSVSVDKITAAAGEIITVTATPQTNYRLENITVKQGSSTIPVTNNKFTMPEGNVTVTALFVEIVESISITPASTTLTKAGQTVTLQANVQPPESAAVSWKSSSNNIATITTDGVVTAVGNGTATITAQAGTKTATATIIVLIPNPTTEPTTTPKPTTEPTTTPKPTTQPSTSPKPSTSPNPILPPSPNPNPGPAATEKPTQSPGGTTEPNVPTPDSITVNPKEEVSINKNTAEISMNISTDMIKDAVLKENKLSITINIPKEAAIQNLNNKDVQNVEMTVTMPKLTTKTVKTQFSEINAEKEIFDAAKKQAKNLTLSVKDSEGQELYFWNFDGSKLNKSTAKINDVNLAMEVNPVKENLGLSNLLAQQQNKTDGIVLQFHHNGVLPTQANVKIYVADQTTCKPGSKVLLYLYNQTTKKLEELAQNTYIIDTKGYVDIKIDHCSDYILLPSAENNKNVTTLLGKISIPRTMSLTLGEKKKITVKNAEGSKISYTSKNKKIADVTKSGVVTTKKVGTTSIITKVTLNGNTKQFTTKIKVAKK